MAKVTAEQTSKSSGHPYRPQFLFFLSAIGIPYCVLRIKTEASSCAVISMRKSNALSRSQAGSFPAPFWCPHALFLKLFLKKIFLLWLIHGLCLKAAIPATAGTQVPRSTFRLLHPPMCRLLPPPATARLQSISAIHPFPSAVSPLPGFLSGGDKAPIDLALLAYNISLNSRQ